MSAQLLLGLGCLGALAYFVTGLVALALLEGIDRVYAITCRWGEVQEFAAVVLWPLSAAWLLWRALRRGRA